MRKLPVNMKLGTATSAFQIEGGWDSADKTPSMWDVYCHNLPKEHVKHCGDDACKSYEYYKRDIAMLKFLGVDFYRFSISWPRILPSGYTNKISEDGRDYYNKIIDELLENKIDPVVTIYHWDLPQNLQELGGWTNPLIVDWFGDYARVLYQLYGDRVKTWITINEPKQIGLFGYGMKRFAPGINAHGFGEYLAAKNIVLAHARAWHIYDDEFRNTQKGTCGITIATDFREGVKDTPEDIEAGKDAIEFEVGLYGHPIFTEKGGFPDRVIHRVAARSAEQGYPRSRLPDFTPEEIEYAKGTSDFYGFNHYSTKFYTRDDFTPGMFPVPSHDDDIGASFTYLDYETGAVPHVTIIPQGIRKALKWVKDNYNNPKILITENGFGTFGGMKDMDRISYYRRYIDAVLDAVEVDGCDIQAYTAWSLMDNCEWDSGTSVKFGLFEVDFDDEYRKRKARVSALWFRKLIETKCLDDAIPPLEEGLLYLHTMTGTPLIHGDIKPANILLDQCNNAKIADFGLARKGPHGEDGTYLKVSSVNGTRPYLPDEYLRSRQLSPAVDVFSFGVVMLEVASALPALDRGEARAELRLLRDYMHQLARNGVDFATLEDPILRGTINSNPPLCRDFISVGLRCTHYERKKRPTMLEVYSIISNCYSTYNVL